MQPALSTLLSFNGHCLLCPRNARAFLVSGHRAPSKLQCLGTWFPAAPSLPPSQGFHREEVPFCETWRSLQGQLITWCCLTALSCPSITFLIFFLTLKRLLDRDAGLSTHPHRSSHQEPAGGQERGTLQSNLTFDNITAILTVCHGACQGTWKTGTVCLERPRARLAPKAAVSYLSWKSGWHWINNEDKTGLILQQSKTKSQK